MLKKLNFHLYIPMMFMCVMFTSYVSAAPLNVYVYEISSTSSAFKVFASWNGGPCVLDWGDGSSLRSSNTSNCSFTHTYGALSGNSTFEVKVRAKNGAWNEIPSQFISRLCIGSVVKCIPSTDNPNIIQTAYDDLPIFSADFYLRYHGDLSAAFGRSNYQAARSHWDNYGRFEGRHSSPSFMVREYIALNSDLESAFGSNYAAAVSHFKNHGINEGRVSSYSFNVREYLDMYSDLRTAFGNDYRAAYVHWTQSGLKEGRLSSIVFSIVDYVKFHSDLRSAFGNDRVAALAHYHLNGIREGRRSSRAFNPTEYLSYYGDLQNSFGNSNYFRAIAHFIVNGLGEGRKSSNEFSSAAYLDRYDDLSAAFGSTNYRSAAIHWLTYGITEGRVGN